MMLRTELVNFVDLASLKQTNTSKPKQNKGFIATRTNPI